ncbi:MAG: hypothetical protein KGK11_02395 [Sphingomonadales bacterium]|nr:hypothetical protein [Sphingomonadales bacterium]
MTDTENTTPKRTNHATRFQPGNAGKPKGARNRSVRALEALVGNSAEKVAEAVIRAAENGDTAAARLVLERVLPARKDRPIAIDLPPIAGPEALAAAGNAVLSAMSSGEISPAEADAIMALIERQGRIAETTDLAERVARLEKEADNG